LTKTPTTNDSDKMHMCNICMTVRETEKEGERERKREEWDKERNTN
jgi:hypothetical protein